MVENGFDIRTAAVVRASFFALFAFSGSVVGCTSRGGGAGSPTGDGRTDDGNASEDGEGTKIDTPAGSGGSTSYHPVKTGNEWTYDFDPGVATCTKGEVMVKIGESVTEGGVTKFLTNSTCDYYGDDSFLIWNDGADVWRKYRGEDLESLIFPDPPAEGRTWKVNYALGATWEKVGEVNVKAGTFDDCWKAVMSQLGGWETYCKGVGPVMGGGENGLHYELVSYHVE